MPIIPVICNAPQNVTGTRQGLGGYGKSWRHLELVVYFLRTERARGY